MTRTSASGSKPSGLATAVLWTLKIIVALTFAGAGYLKLSGNEKMVAEFGEIGLGQWFRYATGLIELTAAGLMLVPRTATAGTLFLLSICAGALVAQLAVLHGDLFHIAVLGGLLAEIARRSQNA